MLHLSTPFRVKQSTTFMENKSIRPGSQFSDTHPSLLKGLLAQNVNQKQILPNFFVRKQRIFLIFEVKQGYFADNEYFSYVTNTQA